MARPKKIVTEYRNYFLPLQFPLVFLTGDHWRISDVPSNRLHFHNCLEIGYCHSDGGHLELYGEPVPFVKGDITVIPRNVPHTTYSAPGCESRWSYLFFDPKLMLNQYLPPTWQNYDLLSYGFKNFRYILNRSEYTGLHQRLMLIFDELTEQKAEYELSVRGLLLSFYIELHRCCNGKRDLETTRSEEHQHVNPLVIAPALDYVEKYYMKKFSTEFLADLCHWSPTHFRRVFSEIMGTTPFEYINSTRILKSCYLLFNTEESILNISSQVGFQSVSSYNRAFSKVMETSPREYRRRMLLSNHKKPNHTILEYTGWTHPENLRDGKENLARN